MDSLAKKLSKKSNQPRSPLKKLQETQRLREIKSREKYNEILNKMEKKNLIRKKLR